MPDSLDKNPFSDPNYGSDIAKTSSEKNPFSDPDYGKEQGRGVSGHVKDLGLSAAAGVNSAVDAAIGIGSLYTGGKLGKDIEDSGVYTPGSGSKYWNDKKTDQSKLIDKQFSDAEGIVDKAKVALNNPSKITNAVVESVPSMIVGGLLGRGAGAITGGSLSGVAAGSVGEGLIMAGGQAEQIRQENHNGLLSDDQRSLSALTGGAGALFGFVGGRIAQKLGIADVDTMLATGSRHAATREAVEQTAKEIKLSDIPKSVVTGAISEGLLEELPQSITEQILQNQALGKEWNEGLDDAIVMGTLAGMAMGGTASGYSKSADYLNQANDSSNSSTADNTDPLLPMPTGGNNGGSGLGIDDAQGEYIPADSQVLQPDLLNQPQVAQLGYEDSNSPEFPEGSKGPANPNGPTPNNLYLDLPKASEQMGINPDDGPLSSAAALAVDGGAYNQMTEIAQASQDGTFISEGTMVAKSSNTNPLVPSNYQQLLTGENDGYGFGNKNLGSESEESIKAPVQDKKQLQIAELETQLTNEKSVIKKVQLRKEIAELQNESPIDQAAHAAATSIQNETPEPTQAQIEAGNYKKGHVKVHGLDISIENPRGSERRGTDPDGNEWAHKMSDHYGYIKKTTGADNEQIDTYVGSNPESDQVYIVDQIEQQSGNFDEHKVMLGFNSQEDAIKAYQSNFDVGWKVGPVRTMTAQQFKTWLKEGDTKKPSIEGLDTSQPNEIGKIEKVFTPSNREIEVRHKLVEANSLIASNHGNGAINEQFPQELQPRDRSRPASQAQINEIATKLNPALLGDSPSTANGAPIVSNDNVVESGNGRILALRKAYEQGNAENYKKWLSEQGHDISGMKNPILVRERTTEMSPEDRIAYTTESNERTTLDLSPTERAMADADKVKNILEDYQGGELTRTANRDFVKKFVTGVVSTNERSSTVDKDTGITQAGVRRIQAALVAAAYGDKTITDLVFEDSDSDIKAIGNALIDAAGSWALMRKFVNDGSIPKDLDVTPNLVEAVHLIHKARSQNKKLIELVQQDDIFTGEVDQVTKDFLSVFYRGDKYTQARSREKVADTLNYFAQQAMQISPGKNLFGEDPKSQTQLMEETHERIQQQEADKQQDIFASQKSNDSNIAATSTDRQRSDASDANEQTSKSEEVKSKLFDRELTLGEALSDIKAYVSRTDKSDHIHNAELLKKIADLNRNIRIHIVSDLDLNKNAFVQSIAYQLQEGGFYSTESGISYIYPESSEWKGTLSELINHELIHALTQSHIDGNKLTSDQLQTLEEIKDAIWNNNKDNVDDIDPDVLDRLNYAIFTSYPHEMFTVFGAEMGPREILKQLGILDKFDSFLSSTLKDAVNDHGQIRQSNNSRVDKAGIVEGISSDANRGSEEVSNVRTTNETGQNRAGSPESKSTSSPKSKEQVNTNQPKEKIQDFGEKLEGAKKDIWKGYAAKLDGVITDPSKIKIATYFPEPNYEQLIAEGIDTKVIGFIMAARQAIPKKPRASYKLATWVANLNAMRTLVHEVVTQQLPFHSLMERMKGVKSLDGLILRIEAMDAVGYPLMKFLNSDIRVGLSRYSFLKDQSGQEHRNVERYYINEAGSYGQYFETKEQFHAELKANLQKKAQASDESVPKAKVVKFDIYRNRRSGEYYVGKEIGSNVHMLSPIFKTSAEAVAYQKNNVEDLIKALENVKFIADHRRKTNNSRIGPDHRNGLDVTPEQFTKVFGFRGVQFGNYVESAKRQSDLNNAYDSLMDLSIILNIPPQAISLNGSLGLAFGARGSGGKNPASAHYERSNIVINLTKNNGAGTLAHEWWHALDNYFSRMRNGNHEYLSDRPTSHKAFDKDHLDAIRPEIQHAWKNLTDVLKNSGMAKRSRSLDSRRTKPYWGTIVEMTARGFEKYVIDMIATRNESNDYLANIVNEMEYPAADSSYPYPSSIEALEINAAYDQLFEEMQNEVTNKGTRLYSRSLSDEKISTTIDDVRKILSERFGAEVIQRLETTGKLHIAQSYEVAGVEGFYSNGQVTLIASNLSAESAIPTFLHELGGHAGFQNIMSSAQYAELMNQFYAMVDAGNPVALAAKNLAERESSKDIQELEYLPYLLTIASSMQEGNVLQKGAVRQFIAKVISAVKAWAFDRLGVQLKLNPDDMVALANRMINRFDQKQTSADHIRAQYKGTKNWMKAPNGEPTNLTEQQWLQVRTPEFKKWFGDWEKDPENASEIIDENGEPQVVYHGTSAHFTKFNLGGGLLGRGVYLTDQYEEAAIYAGVRSRDNTGVIMPLFANIRKAFATTSSTNQSDILGASKSGVFNGIRHSFDNINYLLAFAPSQVKLAIGNSGLFSSTDNDIRYSYAGTNALNADTVGLKRAKKLEKDGKPKDYIRQQTGWFKGMDDHWRFEINDSEASINIGGLDKVINGESITLVELLDHPQIFENYPQFENIKIKKISDDIQNSGSAFWNAYKNEMQFKASLLSNSERLHSAILHELQHAIQTDESFAEGAAPEFRDQALKEYRVMEKYQKSLNNQRQKKAKSAEVELQQIQTQLKTAHGEDRQTLLKLKSSKEKLIQKAKESQAKYDEFSEKVKDLEYTSPIDFYMSVAGEIESRDVEARRDLSDQDRRLIAPYSSQDDYTFRPFIIHDSEVAAAVQNETDPLYSRQFNAQQTFNDIMNGFKNITAQSAANTAKFKMADWLKYGLQALGRRQLTEIFSDLLPQMKEYNRLAAQMDADKNDAGAKADELVREWSKVKDEQELAELMHESTLAKIDPTKPYKSGDSISKFKVLRDKYNALTPEAQKVYRDARDAYRVQFWNVKAAIRDRILRASMGNTKKAELLKQLDDQFFHALKGVYFPLQRFGKYVVLVRDSNGVVESVNRAETKSEAEAVRADLKKQFPNSNVERVILDKDFNASRDAVGRGFMTNLFNELGSLGLNAQKQAEIEDILGQLYLTALPDLSWAKHGIHRKGTAGFSQNARRAFAQNMFHGASYLAKLRYSDLLTEQLDQMQKHSDTHKQDSTFDQNAAQTVINEMEARHESMMNPKSHPLSSTLTSVGFIYYLGLSPASAMVNMLQTALVAYPIMGARWGFDKSANELRIAATQSAKGMNDISKSLVGDELRAYKKAVDTGVIDVTQAHDLAGIAQGEDSGVMWKMRPIMRWASFLFHQAERFNREVTFMASYRLAKQAGANNDQAYDQAVDSTYKGHFDYSSGNRPRIMQGNIAKVLLLFKQFGQNMLYTLVRQAHQSLKGKTQAERTEARKTLAGILTMHAVFAGGMGLPLVSFIIMPAISMLMGGGDDDEPFDAELALRNYLAESIGVTGADVLMHGVSRATPIDISGRVGIDNLIVPKLQDGLEGQDWSNAVMNAALGPVAGIGTNVVKGMQEIQQGHGMRGFETMMPQFVKAPMKALRYADEGALDKTGIAIKDEVSTGGLIGQAMGFSPSEVRLASEGKSAIYQMSKQLDRRRKDLLSDFSRAMKDDDQEQVQEVWNEMKEFSKKNPSRRISYVQAIQSYKARQKRINEAENGIYLPKKKREDMEFGAFANE